MQACLQIQLGAEQAHERAQQCKAGSHRQHIGQRQVETTPAADLATQHYAGKDWQHWQHARGKGQAQARQEKQRQLAPVPGVGCRRAVTVDAQALGFRWIAQAFVGAALVGHDQREGALIGARQFYIEYAVVDLDIAEVLIVLLFALGHLRRAEGDIGRVGAELETMPVKVITLGGDEAQFDRLRRAFYQAQLKGFAHRQEIGTVIDRAQGRTGATLQQTGGGGRQGEY